MSEKILIIEDEENITRLLKVNLLGAGFVVDNALDGEEGLKKVDSFLPDVVVADIRMPKIDGWEVCQKLKTEEKYKNILVIILTASDQKDTREKAKTLCIDAYFSKPVEMRVLIEKIKELIQQQKCEQ